MKQTKEINRNKSLLSELREMEVNDKLTYPIERLSYVRSACVTFGLEWGRKYVTRSNRAERTVTAIRLE